MLPLGEDTENKLAVLDDKFWVWETLDEALRPIISDLSEEQIVTLSKAFAANYKGSEDLWDYIMQKVHFHGATPWWKYTKTIRDCLNLFNYFSLIYYLNKSLALNYKLHFP